jgi:hypothetical protein
MGIQMDHMAGGHGGVGNFRRSGQDDAVDQARRGTFGGGPRAFPWCRARYWQQGAPLTVQLVCLYRRFGSWAAAPTLVLGPGRRAATMRLRSPRKSTSEVPGQRCRALPLTLSGGFGPRAAIRGRRPRTVWQPGSHAIRPAVGSHECVRDHVFAQQIQGPHAQARRAQR